MNEFKKDMEEPTSSSEDEQTSSSTMRVPCNPGSNFNPGDRVCVPATCFDNITVSVADRLLSSAPNAKSYYFGKIILKSLDTARVCLDDGNEYHDINYRDLILEEAFFKQTSSSGSSNKKYNCR